ncbi:MAG: CotH kinase family protein, partial [Oscillospiraceae bacterium]|nr:CotH kinase family protein [Oscillospiraceae bacterium]
MRKIIIVLFLLIAVICGAVIYSSAAPIAPDFMALPTFDDLAPRTQRVFDLVQREGSSQLTVSFSHEEFFYNETINVTISANSPNSVIYYTIDGTIPTSESERYEHPLKFVAEEDVRATVLKAVAIDGKVRSPVFTHSYFVSTSIDKRFSTYVFSISTDPDDLFGYERGILAPGRIRDDYLNTTPEDERVRSRWWPANYFMRGHEWERPVHVEVITQNGKRVITQNTGLRVHGNVSRGSAQKSLRLIAREEYGSGADRFEYDFFYGYMDIHTMPIVSHNTLILRNDGQDYYDARLRTPLASIIAQEAGYHAVSPQAAAAVFLNGEYYGFFWINIRMNEHYLQYLYNTLQKSFDIIAGGGHQVDTDDKEIVNEFMQILDFAKDGFDDDEMQIVHKSFDVDNLLFYYAIQTYISNSDWPSENIAIWRYTGHIDINNPADELDGRWRYLMWDFDHSMHLTEKSAPDIKPIQRLFDDAYSPIFQALLQRPEYIEQYSNYVCDMVFGHFSVLNVERVIQNLNDVTLQEQKISLELHKRSFNSLIRSREVVIDFFEQRPDYILDELRELFGFTKMYRIQSDGTVKINTLNGNEGIYFIENSVPVYPLLEEGQVFDHWLINGEKRYDKDLIISYNDADANDTV